jgi:hypothetical protein
MRQPHEGLIELPAVNRALAAATSDLMSPRRSGRSRGHAERGGNRSLTVLVGKYQQGRARVEQLSSAVDDEANERVLVCSRRRCTQSATVQLIAVSGYAQPRNV